MRWRWRQKRSRSSRTVGLHSFTLIGIRIDRLGLWHLIWNPRTFNGQSRDSSCFGIATASPHCFNVCRYHLKARAGAARRRQRQAGQATAGQPEQSEQPTVPIITKARVCNCMVREFVFQLSCVGERGEHQVMIPRAHSSWLHKKRSRVLEKHTLRQGPGARK